MKGLIAVIVILVLVFFLGPMAAEGTTNSCKALEKHEVSTQAQKIAGGSNNNVVYGVVNGVGQAGATGAAASTAMQQSHPNTPTPVSCTYDYWKSLF